MSNIFKRDIWHFASVKIPALTYDWFEKTARQSKIQGFKENIIKDIARAVFKDKYMAVLTFHVQIDVYPTSFFTCSLLDRKGNVVANSEVLLNLSDASVILLFHESDKLKCEHIYSVSFKRATYN